MRKQMLCTFVALVVSGSLNAKTPLILDTDPALGIIKNGDPRDVDDGFAIIEALNAKKLSLKGITVVFGNSELPEGMKVARRILDLKKASIPLAAGASKPGRDRSPAVKLMAKILKKESAIIAAIGPLTNVANLLHFYPKLKGRIEKVVVVMGRSKGQRFFIGGKGPVRDFNFFKDSNAAQEVINSGVPIVFAPFELSVRATITKGDLEQIKNKNSPVAKYVHSQALDWFGFWRKNFPADRGFHPWDSAAMAYLMTPQLLQCEKRGYRFRQVEGLAHGVGNAATGKKKTKRLWLELDTAFGGRKLTYCYNFSNTPKRFVRAILSRIY